MATHAAQNVGTERMNKRVMKITGFAMVVACHSFLTPYCQGIFQYMGMIMYIYKTYFKFANDKVTFNVCKSFIFIQCVKTGFITHHVQRNVVTVYTERYATNMTEPV